MADNDVKTPDIKTITSAGAPERHDFSNQKQPVAAAEIPAAAPPPATTGDNGAETPEAKAAREAAEAEKNKLPELSEEQLKQLFAAKGIEGFDGNFEALKQKISKADAPVDIPPTEEEKKAAEAASDKRILDHFIETGGSAEAFVALKQIASMDLKELSVAELTKELKEAKFTDDEIKVVLKERYYQLNPDELQKTKTLDADGNEVEESDEDFKKRKELLTKKVSYGSTKLEKRSSHTKQNAETILNNLREAVKAEDSKKIAEAKILSTVDEISKKLPREITFELGEVNKTKIDPVVYKVTEADIAEVVAEFKDPAKRQQILLNEDKTLNLTNLMELKLRNKYLESALKAVYIEGGNRQVAAFEKVFPGSAKALGVGGSQAASTQGRKGVLVSAGQPEVAVPQHK